MQVYLVVVKIIKIGHVNGHISQKNQESKIVFIQKINITLMLFHFFARASSLFFFAFFLLAYGEPF